MTGLFGITVSKNFGKHLNKVVDKGVSDGR